MWCLCWGPQERATSLPQLCPIYNCSNLRTRSVENISNKHKTKEHKDLRILLFVLASHSALQQCSLKRFCIHLLQYRTTLLLLHKPAPQEQHLLSMPWTALKKNKIMEFTRAYNGQYKSHRMEVDIVLFVSQQYCSLQVLEVLRVQNHNEQLTQ